jgi:hypothetical protein
MCRQMAPLGSSQCCILLYDALSSCTGVGGADNCICRPKTVPLPWQAKQSLTPHTKLSLTNLPASSMAFSSLRLPTKTFSDLPSAPRVTLTSILWSACQVAICNHVPLLTRC